MGGGRSPVPFAMKGVIKMNVILYKNSAPPNKIDKTTKIKIVPINGNDEIENVRFIEGNALDILNPSILLDIGTEISTCATFNYCKIPKFDRYYFIEKISTEGGLVRIDCKCDVLMSHKKDILNSTQYILRNENLRSPYLVDNQVPIRSDKRLHQTVFGNPVDYKACPYVILETTGKGGTPV